MYNVIRLSDMPLIDTALYFVILFLLCSLITIVGDSKLMITCKINNPLVSVFYLFAGG